MLGQDKGTTVSAGETTEYGVRAAQERVVRLAKPAGPRGSAATGRKRSTGS